jgi:hypothetical protein
MNLIQQVTSDALQQQTIALPDGTTFVLTIYFVPQQYGWFITSLTYQNFTLNGYRIFNSTNILHQYRNQIPFGIACYGSQNEREPTQQQDFSSGACSLYLLTAAETQQYSDFLLGIS